MRMKDETTDRQRRILEIINEFVDEHGYPPSVREIGTRVGLSSSSTVQSHLRALERLGHISRDRTKPRALVARDGGKKRERVPERDDYVVLPIVGRVAAGTPITAQENCDGEYVVPSEMGRNPGSFMLRVVGDSMIEAGILEGDLIVVEPQATAENGQIVVAMLDGDEVTVKRFYREKGRIRLQPENSRLKPIYADDDVSIVGRVKGVFRCL
jgi:repressor LexA